MVFLYPIFAQEQKGIERHMPKLCKEIVVFVASGDGGPQDVDPISALGVRC